MNASIHTYTALLYFLFTFLAVAAFYMEAYAPISFRYNIRLVRYSKFSPSIAFIVISDLHTGPRY